MTVNNDLQIIRVGTTLWMPVGGRTLDNLTRVIEESVELELNVGGVYALFHFAFPEDKKFWWQLHQEERNHADLLRSINEIFLPANVYPDSLTLPTLDVLKKTNSYLRDLLEQYRKEPPTREEAFQVALQIESSAGEVHFQDFTEEENPSKVNKVFQELVQEDKNHLRRIKEYMKNNHLTIPD